MQKMTKLEKQAEALRTRIGTCRIEDFEEVQAEFFRVKKLAEEHRERLNKQKNAKVKHAKYHRTPQGHTYGTRKKPFVISYVPALKDPDVIQFLLAERAEGQNMTQMITDAIRLLMAAVQSSPAS